MCFGVETPTNLSYYKMVVSGLNRSLSQLDSKIDILSCKYMTGFI